VDYQTNIQRLGFSDDNLEIVKAKFLAYFCGTLRNTINMAQEDLFKNIVAHCKEYGYVFQSSEIYDGLSAVYDYGQYGVELKNNIKKYWWDSMVLLHENVVGLDSAIFMHPKIWKASGHVDAFNDPLIDNRDSKKRYRADILIEEQITKFEGKIEKEIQKARKRFGDNFDEKQFRETNPRVLANQEKIDALNTRFVKALNENDLEEIKQIIIDYEIVCPVSGTRNWTDVRQFNLMFGTEIGSTSEGAMKIFLRPETAQGIFVNFLNVQKSGRMKIPFGIAQIGKAFRNEIVARQFIFRMREFEQMEMQFFVKPGTELEWFKHWKEIRMKWHQGLGFGEENYRFHDHDKLAHYANAATDIEFKFPFGFKEVEGIHSRTDFDLSQHQEYSGKKMQFFDPESNESYIPYVVETSIGVDRMFLQIISASYQQEELKKEDGTVDTRVVLKLPPVLAPVKLAVMPLVKKDGLPEISRSIINELKFDFNCQYDEKDSIGKRYRRQDAIGTPFCITVDHQTKEDNTVTLRYRDTMKQERLSINTLKEIINEKVDISNLLKKL
jgi:glycyl-tRNA synthetase